MLELEVALPLMDAERLLRECEGFLVDGADGREIGVVDGVERAPQSGLVSGLLVASGWFGRRRLRVDAQAIRSFVPAERRVIVDQSQVVQVKDVERSPWGRWPTRRSGT